MNEKLKNIISRTTELALELIEHPVAKEYAAAADALRKDPPSQKLLERLVFLGRDISETLSAGGEVAIERNAEYELMRRDFEDNQIVKRHILAQKEYLIILNKIISLIKDPDSAVK